MKIHDELQRHQAFEHFCKHINRIWYSNISKIRTPKIRIPWKLKVNFWTFGTNSSDFRRSKVLDTENHVIVIKTWFRFVLSLNSHAYYIHSWFPNDHYHVPKLLFNQIISPIIMGIFIIICLNRAIFNVIEKTLEIKSFRKLESALGHFTSNFRGITVLIRDFSH